MSIQNELDKIKNAVYGREVRGAIHDGIKKAYDDASEKDNANMEVKMARGSSRTLGERIEEIDTTSRKTKQEGHLKINALNKRVDNLVATPTTVSEEEIIEARGGERSLGAKIRALDEYSDYTKVDVGEWRQGTIDGGVRYYVDTRIYLEKYIDLDKDYLIRVKEGFNFGLVYYDTNNTFISESAWLEGDALVPSNKGKRLRITATKVPMTPVYPNESGAIEVLTKVSSVNKEHERQKYEFKKLPDSNLQPEVEIGTIVNGAQDTHTMRARTSSTLLVGKGTKVAVAKIEDFEKIDFAVYQYDPVTKEYLLEEPEWRSHKPFVVSEDTEIAVVVRYRDNRVLTTPEAAEALFSKLDVNYSSIINVDKTRDYQFNPMYLTEVENTVEMIKATTKEKSMVFGVLTDTHINGINNQYFKSTVKNIKAVNDRYPIDGIVHLGDVINGDKDKKTEIELLEFARNELLTIHENTNFVMGNHDDNSYGDNYANNNHLLGNEYYSIMQRFRDKNVYRKDSLSSYYQDYDTLNVRIIYLDSYSQLPGISEIGFTQETVDWLRDIALDTERDVLVFSHSGLIPSMSSYEHQIQLGQEIVSILESWQNVSRRVISVISGHSHSDKVDTTSASFPQVLIGCQLFANYTAEDDIAPQSTSPLRKKGTITEDLWDVIVIGLESKQVQFIRFGAGENRVISYG